MDYSTMSTEELLRLKAERDAQKQASTVKPVGAVPAPPPRISPTESTGAPSPSFSSTGAMVPSTGGGSLLPQAPTETVHEPSLPMQERYQRQLAKLPWYEQMLLGLGSVPAQMAQSAKQIMGVDVSDSEIEAVRAVQGAAPGSAIAGGLATLGLPLTRAAQGIERASRTVPILARNPNFARGGAALATAGIEGATTQPTLQDESRAGNAAKSTAITAGLGTAGRLLTQPFRPTKSAEQLMERGVQPTISQGAGGNFGRAAGYLEDIVEAIPLLNKFVGASRERAEEELVKVAARRASPYGAAPESIGDITRGNWFLKQDKAFDDGYKEVLANQNINMGGQFKTSLRPQVSQALNGVDKRVSDDVEAVLAKNLGGLGMVTPGPQWHTAFKEIRAAKRAEQARFAKTSDRDAEKAIEAYRAVEKSMLEARNRSLKGTNNEDLIERLTNLDEAYAHHHIFKKAAENAKAGGEGGIRLEHLIKAVEDETPDYQKIRALGRLQDLTEPAKSVFSKSLDKKDALERRVSNIAAGAALGVGGGVGVGAPVLAAIPAIVAGSSMAASRPGSKLLFGNTAPQKWLAKQMRNKTGALGASYPLGVQDVEE